MITTKLTELKKKSILAIKETTDLEFLESLKVSVLGKKGELTHILKGLSELDPAERPQIGQLANQVKTEIQELITIKKESLDKHALDLQLKNESEDVSLPSIGNALGHKHPINQTISELESIFNRLGFTVKQGPDIETDFYNFEALNIPKDHPARDMHDTFYLKKGHVLRTHTSPVQVHVMETQAPPIKIIIPGKVYRCDSDVSHSPVFHQIEGLYVDEHVTFSELKGTLEFFLKEVFGQKKKVRFRPSYFPFTEPSTEVDVECVQCRGKGCSLCKQTGWLEILGAGMVNNNVFRSVNYDVSKVSGFAFGLGVDRIAMLLFGISDIRLLYENDMRFLKQF